MIIKEVNIPGLKVIEPDIFHDERGFFFEIYHSEKYNKDINQTFVQDNYSYSLKNVLRGLHFQKNKPQAKLVQVINGSVFDVAVDLRKESKTYGKYFSIELSSENNKQLLIPKGFAHGFQVLSDQAIVNYKVDEYYNPNSVSGIIWNDKDLSIKWNDINPILSQKDLNLISFKNLKSPFF